jgi:anti-sigma regulatory factor (Ser/Thr protein kinase)/DNA-binding NarL/FixJ family response regulator
MTSNCDEVSATHPASQRAALIVDSSPEINALLESVLTNEGWSIHRVPDNQAVLSAVAANPFDLIVTASRTQGSEDLELLRKIRNVRPHLRLIILTDEWTRGDVIRAMQEHAFSYFSGPFHYDALVEMVRWAVNSPCWDDGIEVLSATPEWVQLRARCDAGTANRLIQFLRAAKDPEIPEDDREAVTLAFREILMNAMEHGGNFDPKQFVEISYVRAHRAIVCRVKDPGQGFSLEELRHAAINSPVDDLFRHVAVREAQGLRPGGFGLLLSKKLVDELIYNEKGNDVLLVKYLHKTAVAS